MDSFSGAFLWEKGNITKIVSLDPSVIAIQPHAINLRGQVVGAAVTDIFGGGHGFLWENGQMIDLSPLTVAYGINDRGQVVGQANGHATLWQDGRLIDLGALGGSSVARGINNYGEVVGNSVTLSGQTHALLWKPD
jgi:probable HAF family extracellular repeat protein